MLFGAVTIVLAVLAILIGVIAIWGYNTIKNEAQNIARNAAAQDVQKYIAGDEVKSLIQAESRRTLAEETASFMQGLELAESQPAQLAQPASEPPPGPVSQSVPGAHVASLPADPSRYPEDAGGGE